MAGDCGPVRVLRGRSAAASRCGMRWHRATARTSVTCVNGMRRHVVTPVDTASSWLLTSGIASRPGGGGCTGLRLHHRHWSPPQHPVAGTYRTPVHGPAMAGPPHTPDRLPAWISALPKILVNSTRSGHMTWSKCVTLYHGGQSPAPVLLQVYVSLSTTDSGTRSPADHIFAGQRAFTTEI